MRARSPWILPLSLLVERHRPPVVEGPVGAEHPLRPRGAERGIGRERAPNLRHRDFEPTQLS